MATGVGKPKADSEERANSAGRFRHDCPRKSLPSGKSAGRCGHRPLHIPRSSSMKSNISGEIIGNRRWQVPRRTARNERIPPDGFNTTAPETTLPEEPSTPPETKTFHLPAATGTAGGMPVPASRQIPASGQRLCSVRSFRQRCRLPDLWRR